MAFPLLLFGLYSGLIAKQVDSTVGPFKIIIFPLKVVYKKIILGIDGFRPLNDVLQFHHSYHWNKVIPIHQSKIETHQF